MGENHQPTDIYELFLFIAPYILSPSVGKPAPCFPYEPVRLGGPPVFLRLGGVIIMNAYTLHHMTCVYNMCVCGAFADYNKHMCCRSANHETASECCTQKRSTVVLEVWWKLEINIKGCVQKDLVTWGTLKKLRSIYYFLVFHYTYITWLQSVVRPKVKIIVIAKKNTYGN